MSAISVEVGGVSCVSHLITSYVAENVTQHNTIDVTHLHLPPLLGAQEGQHVSVLTLYRIINYSIKQIAAVVHNEAQGIRSVLNLVIWMQLA
jgi:hypothetical protein